jgi:quercetin dioxygenase-like cupin family protein
MVFLKNIEHEKILQLKDQVQVAPGQVVSKTLVQNQAVSITLFAFAKDEEISTHKSDGDALVTVLEGSGLFTVNGKEHLLQAGDSLVMPAGLPHAIYADKDFKWILTVVF